MADISLRELRRRLRAIRLAIDELVTETEDILNSNRSPNAAALQSDRARLLDSRQGIAQAEDSLWHVQDQENPADKEAG